MLDKHNALRRKVARGEQSGQPAAANMRQLVWNDELAAIAQRWADQCMDDCPASASICHEKDLISNPTGFENLRNKLDGTKVGKNIGITVGTGVSGISSFLTETIQDWYDESSLIVKMKPYSTFL